MDVSISNDPWAPEPGPVKLQTVPEPDAPKKGRKLQPVPEPPVDEATDELSS